MCGSGTTLDVAKELNRKSQGFDLAPSRPDIKQNDARKLPLESDSIDFAFIDPPYSTHVDYSDDPRCIGKLDASSFSPQSSVLSTNPYYAAMSQVIAELHRVLKNRRYMALYVSDSFKKGQPFMPIGFELFRIMQQHFKPIDIITVVRHNRTLQRNHWHTAAIEGNYYLRGFNYLFIMKKEQDPKPRTK
jgi:DNA modification methylase